MIDKKELLKRKEDWLNLGFERIDQASEDIGVLIDKLHRIFQDRGHEVRFEVYDAIEQEANPTPFQYVVRTRNIVPYVEGLEFAEEEIIPAIRIYEQHGRTRLLNVEIGIPQSDYNMLRFRKELSLQTGREYSSPSWWSSSASAIDYTEDYDIRKAKAPEDFVQIAKKYGAALASVGKVHEEASYYCRYLLGLNENEFPIEKEEIEDSSPDKLWNDQYRDRAIGAVQDLVYLVDQMTEVKKISSPFYFKKLFYSLIQRLSGEKNIV